MNDHRCCPNCGYRLTQHPYLMQSHADACPPRWAGAGKLLLLFLFAIGVFLVIAPHA